MHASAYSLTLTQFTLDAPTKIVHIPHMLQVPDRNQREGRTALKSAQTVSHLHSLPQAPLQDLLLPHQGGLRALY